MVLLMVTHYSARWIQLPTLQPTSVVTLVWSLLALPNLRARAKVKWHSNHGTLPNLISAQRMLEKVQFSSKECNIVVYHMISVLISSNVHRLVDCMRFFSLTVTWWKAACNADRLRDCDMNKQTVMGDAFYMLSFILNPTKMHTRTQRDERKRWFSLVLTRPLSPHTVGNITPQSGLTANQIYLCLSLSPSPSARFCFENVFMTMHFIWQIWYHREISAIILYLLIDLKLWTGQKDKSTYPITQCSEKL